MTGNTINSEALSLNKIVRLETVEGNACIWYNFEKIDWKVGRVKND